MRPRTAPQRGFNLEYMMWVFTRISGVAIFTLALIGLGSAFAMHARTGMDLVTLLRWTFFPNSYHVQAAAETIDIDPFTTGIWRIMQLMIIFFASTHGLNGIRMILEDYTGPSIFRLLLRGILFTLWLFMIFIAVTLIYTS